MTAGVSRRATDGRDEVDLDGIKTAIIVNKYHKRAVYNDLMQIIGMRAMID